LPIAQVQASTFLYSRYLDSLIKLYNPCSKTIFYMTWGRKNGDASNCGTWPPVCTYNGMDSLLTLRYKMLADMNRGLISPVAVVWKYIRQNYPQIELYDADESHPSLEGSYAAACCFYTIIFRKNPVLISNSYTISPAVAASIRMAVKTIVYDNLLTWNVGENDPVANFNFSNTNNKSVSFLNQSQNSFTNFWNFGDGTTSTNNSIIHTYTNNGLYNVKLITKNCALSDSIVKVISINDALNNDLNFSPNPTKNNLVINITNIEKLSITNAAGQIFRPSYKQVGQTSVVNLSNFSAGIYYVKVLANGKIMTGKIVKANQ
jgi:PKD domain/Secretion system C-terminal sorting domain